MAEENIFAKFATPQASSSSKDDNIFAKFSPTVPAKPAETSKQSLHTIPDPFTDVAPSLINFVDAPARAVASDIYGVTPLLRGEGLTREQYESRRDKAFEATAIPESKTGQAISSVLNFPGRVIGEGAHLIGQAVLGSEREKQVAPFVGAAADVASLAAPITGPKMFPGRAGISSQEASAGRLENRARSQLSSSFERGMHEGGIGAVDVFNDMAAARKQGQPFALADIQNPELRSLIGSVYRQGGEARSIISDFMKGRNVEQGDRIRGQLKQYISDESARETAEELLKRRSENAKPLFDEAAAGGSIAPLEHQFQQAFNALSLDEHDVLREMRISPHSNAATARLEDIRAEKAKIHEKLLRAQADRSAATPGAVWSPRLQTMLDLPEVKQGISRGYAMERRKAVGENRPFRPNEYAAIGEDAEGNPIVGEVPNMRLLMVAKEGLDAIIAENMDSETGRPTKTGLSYIVLQDGLLNELDRLNPLYKQAREQWSGDTNSHQAIKKGKNLLNTKWFPEQIDVERYLSQLSESDREFVKVGLASDLLEKVNKAQDAADKSKRVINSDLARERVTTLLGDQAEPFLDAIERERTMRETPTQLTGRSPTAERHADDRRIAERSLSALGSFFGYHHIPGLGYAVGAATRYFTKPNERLNAAVAKIATDPKLKVETGVGKPLLPSQKVQPRARRAVSPIEGALIGAEGAQSTR